MAGVGGGFELPGRDSPPPPPRVADSSPHSGGCLGSLPLLVTQGGAAQGREGASWLRLSGVGWWVEVSFLPHLQRNVGFSLHPKAQQVPGTARPCVEAAGAEGPAQVLSKAGLCTPVRGPHGHARFPSSSGLPSPKHSLSLSPSGLGASPFQGSPCPLRVPRQPEGRAP